MVIYSLQGDIYVIYSIYYNKYSAFRMAKVDEYKALIIKKFASFDPSIVDDAAIYSV